LRSPSGTGLADVNGGTVTFTVVNSLGNTVGTPPAPAAVLAGTASASYTIPAGTNAGTYTILAQFSGSGSFALSTDDSQTLTITPAPTTTTGHDATRVFSVAAGMVTLTADVATGVGAINDGAVVFQLYDSGNNPIGSATSGDVTGGTATVSYPLPSSLTSGTYTIQAAYGGAANLAPSSDATPHALSITRADTTVTATSATATFSGLNQNVTLTAAVASPAGTVNGGTVTFTLKDGVGTIIGTASGMVTNGTAISSPAFVLPANTPAGTYTIQADYANPVNYNPSTDATHTMTVAHAPQTIAFPSLPATIFSPAGTVPYAPTGGDTVTPVC
jgi:hypothetical protein